MCTLAHRLRLLRANAATTVSSSFESDGERTMTLSAKRHARRGRGHDKTGRSRRGDRFVKLDHWMLKSPAWRALTPAARALYVELAQRYNGANNGEISLSVREAAAAVNIAKDTASKTFQDLIAIGFIRRRRPGSFTWKVRHAATWILTEFPVGDEPATKDFMRWPPGKSEAGPNPRTARPDPGTVMRTLEQAWSAAVPGLGPWVRFCTAGRSQTAARI